MRLIQTVGSAVCVFGFREASCVKSHSPPHIAAHAPPWDLCVGDRWLLSPRIDVHWTPWNLHRCWPHFRRSVEDYKIWQAWRSLPGSGLFPRCPLPGAGLSPRCLRPTRLQPPSDAADVPDVALPIRCVGDRWIRRGFQRNGKTRLFLFVSGE